MTKAEQTANAARTMAMEARAKFEAQIQTLQNVRANERVSHSQMQSADAELKQTILDVAKPILPLLANTVPGFGKGVPVRNKAGQIIALVTADGAITSQTHEPNATELIESLAMHADRQIAQLKDADVRHCVRAKAMKAVASMLRALFTKR